MVFEKNTLRSTLRHKRKLFLDFTSPLTHKKALTSQILEFIAQALPTPCSLYAFWPLEDEPDIKDSLHYLEKLSYRISLPKIISLTEPLVFSPWNPQSPLISSPFVPSWKLQEPNTPYEDSVPSLVLVPCLGYDVHGTRLGYGKGLYDRTLCTLKHRHPKCLFIGVSHECGNLPYIPRKSHDIPLHGIITESTFFFL